jgi:hypothetical protein
MAVVEQALLDSRRAFPMAQQLLAGGVTRVLPARVSVGWHDTSIEPEAGSIAVVRRGAGLDDLFGSVLALTDDAGRELFVYVIGARGVPFDISVARRPFLSLGLLSRESVRCPVGVVDG